MDNWFQCTKLAKRSTIGSVLQCHFIALVSYACKQKTSLALKVFLYKLYQELGNNSDIKIIAHAGEGDIEIETIMDHDKKLSLFLEWCRK